MVVIMSDDETVEEMRFMPATERLIGAAGATFSDSIVNWPLCCPSRATYLTGQYAHNHGVLGNSPPQGGFDRLDTAHTLPVWLQRSGYWTNHIGKFLNGYEGSDVGVPPGWSEWHGTKRTYMFYGYELYEAGQTVVYGSPDENPDAPAQPGTYSTDVFTDKAVQSIAERAPSDQPFFLNVAYLAPHAGGPDGGPQSRCADTAKPASVTPACSTTSRSPSRRTSTRRTSPTSRATIAALPLLTAEQIARATRNYRCRGESVLAVDEGVKRIVDELRESGELDETLVVFTSDNGFFHGEHRLSGGKNRVYEEAVRVPLMMRGPGIPRGVEVRDEVSNADLAPTIIDAAGARADHLAGRADAAALHRRPHAHARPRAPDRAGHCREAERKPARDRVPGDQDRALQVRPLLGQPGRAVRPQARSPRTREPPRRPRLRRRKSRPLGPARQARLVAPASPAGPSRRCS